MNTKRKSKKRNSRGTEALLDSLSELEVAVHDGLTLDDIKRKFPGRVRIVAPSPGDYPPNEVKALRDQIGVTQADFASLLGVSRILVQGWERGVREPSGLACRLLDTISKDPAAWLASLRPTARQRSRRAG